MEAAIIGALVTALLGALGWMITSWVRSVRERLNRHDILHAESKDRHGRAEIKIATIVAELDNLTKVSEETHKDVKTLLANGRNNRGTGEP